MNDRLKIRICFEDVAKGEEFGPAGELNVSEQSEDAARTELVASESKVEQRCCIAGGVVDDALDYFPWKRG